MKRGVSIIAGILFLSAISGCQNAQTRVGEGALIGGLAGGAAGGIIGHQSHHGGQGAGVGVAAGAILGAIVGSQIQKPAPGSAATPQGSTPRTVSASQMTLQQIVDLSKQGVAPAVIIDKIRLTNSRFLLNDADLAYLKEQGVSRSVIDEMQGAR